MRIRLFRAFASNNSGSYTIVGSFASVADAEAVASELRAVCAEHDAWHEANDGGEASADLSPLDVFVRAHGLHEARPGREDEWPEHGPSPAVSALGAQVILHAPYTLTMPRLFGEYFYRRGGRVDVELVHAHEAIIVEILLFVPPSSTAAATESVLDELERELVTLVPTLCARSESDPRPAVAPVFRRERWGGLQVAAVFADLVVGVEAVRQAAVLRGVTAHCRVYEGSPGLADPLAPLRVQDRRWGRARVVLWSVGERVPAMKAVREVLSVGLVEAHAAIDGLPAEILVGVDDAYARRAVEILRAAGCDAEVVAPAR